MLTLEGKVLITGASGFVGGNLRKKLTAAGNEVVTLRRPNSPEPSSGRSVVADYSNRASLVELIKKEKPAYIFHVAGVTKGRTYSDFEMGNVMPTRHLGEAAVESGVDLERFVYVSSLASYGPARGGQPVKESDEQRPVEYYGQSKRDAEKVVKTFEHRLPCTIIRPAAVYGPGDDDVFQLFLAAAKRKVNVFFGNRKRLVSIIYVDDCVQGIVDAARSESTVGRGYFLAHEKPVTWEELQTEIVNVMTHKVRTLDLPQATALLAAWWGELAMMIDGEPRLFNRQKLIMGAQQAWTCSIEAAQRDFGFAPSITIQQGVPATHKWYEQAGWYL